jgi:hypothetical protein
MILLNNNATNTFYVTASERSTIYVTGGTPSYTILFENQETKETKSVVPIIVSLTDRADELTLIVSGSSNESLLNGIIYLDNVSTYKYYIYESHSPTLSTSGNVLEYGYMQIDNYNNNTMQYSGGSRTILTYGGQ